MLGLEFITLDRQPGLLKVLDARSGLDGQITVQDKPISGEKKQTTKLCSDPQATVAEAKCSDN
jgi:hypothetical protein